MIHFEQVTKAYGGNPAVLRCLNFQVRPGEFVSLIGRSGCGKSTTLSLINRLIEPTSGTIRVDGQDIATTNPVALRRRIGFVFQGIGLFPHLTIAENIGITPRLLGWPAVEIKTRVRELLDLVRLPPTCESRLPRELSGGEQQRIGLARALAARPRIMLMDEPFGALDPLVRDELAADYSVIHRQLRLTTVLVTHDMTEALLLSNKIIVQHAGGIVQIGTPQKLLSAPADEVVAALIESPRRRIGQLTRLLEQGSML
ncbi:MAG: ATP-binding cassette domain-containing protein [Alphaproteobacteria bacterium]|nr:ATP-binding cassette domain-containing protein [Alphaproteobacteria bacterium]MBV9063862.1 ATP-binding cassette domain-containing protein [Alphaproteobacteria bacterium]